MNFELRRSSIGFFSPQNYDDALLDALKIASLNPADAVLDAGCGMGSLISLCMPWIKKGVQIVCMDIDKKGLEAAKKRAEAAGVLKQVTFREQYFTESIYFQSEEYDAVFSLFSIYAVADKDARKATLNNFKSSLKKDGRLILEVPISSTYGGNAFLVACRK